MMKLLIAFLALYLVGLGHGPAVANEDGEEMWRAESDAATRGPRRGFFYGAGISLSQTPYEGFGTRLIPLPMVGYMGERLRVFGPFVTYDVVQLDGLTIAAKLQPRFGGFSEDDSSVLTGMSKRRFTFEAGASVRYSRNKWWAQVEAQHDILGRSDGYEASISAGYDARFGPLILTPRIGASYQSQKMVDYYYGVRADEATANRSAYRGEDGWNWQAGLALGQPAFSGMLRLNVDYVHYGQAIQDSPLVDKSSSFGAMLGYTRFF